MTLLHFLHVMLVSPPDEHEPFKYVPSGAVIILSDMGPLFGHPLHWHILFDTVNPVQPDDENSRAQSLIVNAWLDVVKHAAPNPTFGLGIKSEEKNAEIWDFYFGNIVVCNRPFGLGIVLCPLTPGIIPHCAFFRKGYFDHQLPNFCTFAPPEF